MLCTLGLYSTFSQTTRNANIGIFVFTKQKNPVTKCYPPVGIEPLISSDSKSNSPFACKAETLGSLYSYAILILTKSSKSKNQVVYKHKFKDLLSSTFLTSLERRLLDLESEVMRGPGSIPTRGIIFVTGFFWFSVKTKIPILAFSCSL